MPMYLGKEVSDTYMQSLIGAYRDGQESVGGNVEDSDDIIIERLTAESVLTEVGAKALGTDDTKREQA